MASFTEQATLKVVDKSTAEINKINAALKALFATARSLKSATIKIKVSATGIEKVLADLKKLNKEAKKNVVAKAMATTAGAAKQVVKTVKPATQAVKQLGTTGTTAAQKYTSALARVSQAQRQHNQHVVAAVAHQRQLQRAQRTPSGVPRVSPAAGPWGPRGGGRGGAPPPPPHTPPAPRTGGGSGRTAGGAFLAGFGGGIGMGLSRLNESFGLVAAAGWGAAKALRAVGEAAAARERKQLAVEGVSSADQRAIFAEADRISKARGDYIGALRFKEDDFKLARASFLGDVGNWGKPGDKDYIDPKSKAGELERAYRADILARHLYKNVVPGMYMRNPNMTFDEAQEGLKKFVQSLGISTQQMFDKDDKGNLVLSKDFNRVAEGFRKGMIAAPDITPAQIKTATASIKSLGYSATSDQIAEIILNVSSKGQRAANEAYQAYKTGLGIVDVGKLNTAIDDLGLFLPGTAKRHYTKKYPQGLVRPATGIPRQYIDPETGEAVKLGERSSEWWRLAMSDPAVQKKAADYLVNDAVRQSAARGESKTQQKAAGAAARSKYAESEATAVTDFINRMLQGAKGTALQGILDAILGGPITKGGLAQADVAPKPDEINRRLDEAWTTQFGNLQTATSDAAAKLGELAANAIGLAGILRGMTSFIDQNPLASGAIAIAIGTAVGVAVIVPFAALTRAAFAITAAAGRLGAVGLPGGGIPGGKPGAPGTPPSGTPKAGGGLGRGLAIGGALLLGGVSAVGWALLAHDLYQMLPDDPAAARKRLAAEEGLREAQRRLNNEKDTLALLQGGKSTPEAIARQLQIIADRQKDVDQRQAESDAPKPVKTISVGPDGKPLTELPGAGTGAGALDAVTPSAITAAVTAAVNDHLKKNPKAAAAATMPDTAAITKAVTEQLAKTSPDAPASVVNAAITKAIADAMGAGQPVKRGGKTPLTPAVTAPAPDSLAALIPQLTKTAESITLSISGLTTAGNTFSTVFSTGATAISGAGQKAADALNGAAPGIGAAIGNAAARAIAAATANISVNVNTNMPAASTGPQKPD